MTRIKRFLAILILAPLVVVAEYFFVLTFTEPYSRHVTTENAIFFVLGGSALTLITLYLIARTYKDRKKPKVILWRCKTT